MLFFIYNLTILHKFMFLLTFIFDIATDTFYPDFGYRKILPPAGGGSQSPRLLMGRGVWVAFSRAVLAGPLTEPLASVAGNGIYDDASAGRCSAPTQLPPPIMVCGFAALA